MMKKVFLLAIIALGFFAISCDDDDNTTTTSELTLNLTGLEDLGSEYVYEGWIIVDGSPVSSGTFTSVSFPQTFIINSEQLASATTFVLSIEPSVDNDPAPAATKILVGDFSGNSATVSTAIVGDFSNSSGKYILATPTDGSDSNENSGIWFLDLSTGSPAIGLDLPVLDDGWRYEGWAVIDGTPVTSGTFTAIDEADLFDNFSSTMNPGPPFPGEDYLMNAPSGLTFPTDLAGGTAVISIEPYPDNSPAPFTLKPLVGAIAIDAIDHTTYDMSLNISNLPAGSVSR
ncbi:anti-sigma factor [Urechidicola croceus]|uniref:Anti-sigma factor n=1 Tax=Urechidicola croceus TaxID=1850246 RepID=A0A1D8P541_9FLAO|nr:anti-sigma factor [Urechidicola croceus]AOW19702.1 hypothetical protein LPB138_02960 [Urechidicola croceus]